VEEFEREKARNPRQLGLNAPRTGNTLGAVELEERTIEQLPDRCDNCGAQLTDAEKQTALTEGPPGGRVLCTTCASEVVPLEEDEEELES
jgi:hypothetical protein